MSTGTTKKAWKEREEVATLILALAAKRQAIMHRLLRYREENARPEDRNGRLPQEVAADRAGVRARQWQRWEKGETVPHPRNLQQLAERLSIPVGEFFDSEPEPQGDTPDLMGAVSGEHSDDELRARLDQIDARTDEIAQQVGRIVEALGLDDPAPEFATAVDALAEAVRALRAQREPGEEGEAAAGS